MGRIFWSSSILYSYETYAVWASQVNLLDINGFTFYIRESKYLQSYMEVNVFLKGGYVLVEIWAYFRIRVRNMFSHLLLKWDIFSIQELKIK